MGHGLVGHGPCWDTVLKGDPFEIGPKFFLIHWFSIFFLQIHGFLWVYILFPLKNALFFAGIFPLNATFTLFFLWKKYTISSCNRGRLVLFDVNFQVQNIEKMVFKVSKVLIVFVNFEKPCHLISFELLE